MTRLDWIAAAAFAVLVVLVFGGAVVLDATGGDSHHGDVVAFLLW
jgi:hypothetical protein